jgi:5'-nucleotidase
MEKLRDRVYEVDGTPTDCVNIAVTQVYTPSSAPDLIVSGINKGWNLGDDVTYSGTVAGALEGSLLGIPSIAVSLSRTRGKYDFGPAAAAAATIASMTVRNGIITPRTFLNINVPPRQAEAGFRASTFQAKRNTRSSIRGFGSARPALLLD